MGITLSEETQRLIEERLRESGLESPDDLVRMAIQSLDQADAGLEELLDEETWRALEEADRECDEGKCLPVDVAFAKLRDELGLK